MGHRSGEPAQGAHRPPPQEAVGTLLRGASQEVPAHNVEARVWIETATAQAYTTASSRQPQTKNQPGKSAFSIGFGGLEESLSQLPLGTGG